MDVDPVQLPSTSAIQPRRRLTTPNFKWKSRLFKPIVHQFDPSVSGVNKSEFELNDDSPIIDFFESFFTPSLLGKVAFETNRYYHQNTENQVLGDCDKRWYDTTSEEMYMFIAINMLMARKQNLNFMNTGQLMHYFILFGQIMSRNRYQILLRYLHFTNNDHQVADNRLYKIQMVLDEVKINF